MNQFTLSPSPRDRRDFIVTFPVLKSEYIDLRPQLPEIYDQGRLNSCTAMAICGVIQQTDMPSRMFIWYNTRHIQRNHLTNSGVSIRDAVHSVVKVGVCRESLWPYVLDNFDDRPLEECYVEASRWKIEMYARVNQEEKQLEGALRSQMPIIFGMRIHKSFHDARKTGIVQRPQPNEEFLGGHAMVIVGCDPSKRMFIVRNSWGTRWGDKGHCLIPYDLILDKRLSYDLWVLKDIDNQAPLTVISTPPDSSAMLCSWKTPLDSFSRATGEGTGQFDLTLSAAIREYSLERHFREEWPSCWQILGSNDRTSWEVIDTKKDVPPADTIRFELSTRYKHIRFVATKSSFKEKYGFGRRVSLKRFSCQ